MKNDLKKVGRVALVGRPNVGKSTLLNAILKHKVAIVSPKPQTTRSQIVAYLEDDRGQIFFLDTPGYYVSSGASTSYNSIIKESLKEADVVVYIIDHTRDWGREDQLVWQQVELVEKPTILVFNKSDVKEPTFRKNYESLLLDRVERVVSVSATRRSNINLLLDVIFELLPVGERDKMVDEFPTPLLSQSSREYVAELIRERIFMYTGQEIPYITRVRVDSLDQDEVTGDLSIEASILVPEKRHVGMLVGKAGSKIKQIRIGVVKELRVATNLNVDLYLLVEHE